MTLTGYLLRYNGTLVTLPTCKAAKSSIQATRNNDGNFDATITLRPQPFSATEPFGWIDAATGARTVGKTMAEIHGDGGTLRELLDDGWVERNDHPAGVIMLDKVVEVHPTPPPSPA